MDKKTSNQNITDNEPMVFDFDEQKPVGIDVQKILEKVNNGSTGANSTALRFESDEQASANLSTSFDFEENAPIDPEVEQILNIANKADKAESTNLQFENDNETPHAATIVGVAKDKDNKTTFVFDNDSTPSEQVKDILSLADKNSKKENAADSSFVFEDETSQKPAQTQQKSTANALANQPKANDSKTQADEQTKAAEPASKQQLAGGVQLADEVVDKATLTDKDHEQNKTNQDEQDQDVVSHAYEERLEYEITQHKQKLEKYLSKFSKEYVQKMRETDYYKERLEYWKQYYANQRQQAKDKDMQNNLARAEAMGAPIITAEQRKAPVATAPEKNNANKAPTIAKEKVQEVVSDKNTQPNQSADTSKINANANKTMSPKQKIDTENIAKVDAALEEIDERLETLKKSKPLTDEQLKAKISKYVNDALLGAMHNNLKTTRDESRKIVATLKQKDTKYKNALASKFEDKYAIYNDAVASFENIYKTLFKESKKEVANRQKRAEVFDGSKANIINANDMFVEQLRKTYVDNLGNYLTNYIFENAKNQQIDAVTKSSIGNMLKQIVLSAEQDFASQNKQYELGRQEQIAKMENELANLRQKLEQKGLYAEQKAALKQQISNLKNDIAYEKQNLKADAAELASLLKKGSTEYLLKGVLLSEMREVQDTKNYVANQDYTKSLADQTIATLDKNRLQQFVLKAQPQSTQTLSQPTPAEQAWSKDDLKQQLGCPKDKILSREQYKQLRKMLSAQVVELADLSADQHTYNSSKALQNAKQMAEEELADYEFDDIASQSKAQAIEQGKQIGKNFDQISNEYHRSHQVYAEDVLLRKNPGECYNMLSKCVKNCKNSIDLASAHSSLLWDKASQKTQLEKAIISQTKSDIISLINIVNQSPKTAKANIANYLSAVHIIDTGCIDCIKDEQLKATIETIADIRYEIKLLESATNNGRNLAEVLTEKSANSVESKKIEVASANVVTALELSKEYERTEIKRNLIDLEFELANLQQHRKQLEKFDRQVEKYLKKNPSRELREDETM